MTRAHARRSLVVLTSLLMALPAAPALAGPINPLPSSEVFPRVPVAAAQFGKSVAYRPFNDVDRDNYAVFGAPGEFGGADRSGIAYLARVTEGFAGVPAAVRPPDPQVDSNFGGAVAIATSHVVIGASAQDIDGRADQGAAYAGALFGQLQRLQPLEPAAGEYFGVSVDISSDGSVIVVGAPLDTTAGRGRTGAAHVFLLADGVWSPVQTLVPSIAEAGDRAGGSVAISPDGQRIAVGLPDHDVLAFSNSGAVAVYEFRAGVWQEITWEACGLSCEPGQRMGQSVDIAGSRVVAGIPYRPVDGLLFVGAAYGFSLDGGPTWRLEPGEPVQGQQFGDSVSLSENGRTLLVGAPRTPSGGQVAGGVAFLYRDGEFDRTLRRPLETSNSEVGTAVALAPDAQSAILGGPSQTVDGKNLAGGAVVFAAQPPEPTIVPGVSGTPSEVMTARRGRWPGARVNSSIDWYRCSRAGGAVPLSQVDNECQFVHTGPTYRAEVNRDAPFTRASVIATTSAGSTFYASATVRVVAPVAGEPVSVSPPSITRSGGRLRARPGEWSGNNLSFAYSWWRCAEGHTALISPYRQCVRVGAGRRYRPVAADAGAYLAVQVTATNRRGALTQVSPTRRMPAASR